MSVNLVPPPYVLNILRQIVWSGPHDGGSLPICVFDLQITSRIYTKSRTEILQLSSRCDHPPPPTHFTLQSSSCPVAVTPPPPTTHFTLTTHNLNNFNTPNKIHFSSYKPNRMTSLLFCFVSSVHLKYFSAKCMWHKIYEKYSEHFWSSFLVLTLSWKTLNQDQSWKRIWKRQHTVRYREIQCIYVEIKCQLDATYYIYCRLY